MYSGIKDITDKNYYTNSFYILVYHNISVLYELNLEAIYNDLSNVCYIAYIEL